MNDPGDEKRVEELLRPLQLIAPVSLPARQRARPARRWRLSLLASAAALIAAGVAVAGGVTSLGVFERPTVAPNIASDGADDQAGVAQSECHLLGRPARAATAFFAARGIEIEWRLTRYATPAKQPNSGKVHLREGFTTIPDDVPSDSIVWNVVHEPQLGASRVIVFVHAADDLHAPVVAVPTSCRE